ncbi:thioredoxin-related transmembrane protein 2 homolog [Tribolium madens]|uniref:thioredoxin-related transmembrane protein 2 homolog n=1 Tax=Tribolium madens TaxID=41895 RepID=UPI001CF7660C|nr:thioredoxin-related transmembrane protein 2 homolog [Tribolium madens]XP_044261328.1 thioredoxin-related transmembrane protein 2 homolog [Tribolium madens]
MSIKADFKQLLKPYYLFNIILSLSYVILKRTPGVCNYLFHVEECEFDGRETEILFFLIIVIMIRTRKSGSVSMINYLSSSFVYTKIANLILWFNADFLMGIIYGIIFILGALLFPEPTYSGPDNVIYFRGLQGLDEELSRSRDGYWLVTFYTVWNPACVNFAPIFAKLSTEYVLENLKFGKIDVGRYPDAAQKYHVNDSSLSKQLPTTILFKEGKEVVRRPAIDSKGNIMKFFFSSENIKGAFNLNNLYEECKSAIKNKKKHVKNE